MAIKRKKSIKLIISYNYIFQYIIYKINNINKYINILNL